MSAKHINSKDFEEKVLKNSNLVVVDFYAPWCGPCKMAGPIFDKLANEFAGKVEIVKVNVDESQEIAQKYNVMSIPTVIAFVKGKEADRQIGFVGEDGYRGMIDNLLNN